MTIRAGVIGAGRLGRQHARVYAEMAGCVLVGVHDIDAGRAEAVAHEFGVRAFEQCHALLDAVDAVSVAVPTAEHASVGCTALEAGAHVLVEKPIAATVAEAERMVATAGSARRHLGVGHVERFNPAFMVLREMEVAPRFIESHRLAAYSPRGTDVAVVLDLMIHDLDLLLALTPSHVTEVAAVGVSVVSSQVDIANARLVFGDGCVANVTASRFSQKQMRRMRVFQRDAYMALDFLEGTCEVIRLRRDAPLAEGEPLPLEGGILRRPEVEPLAAELGTFVAGIREGRSPSVDGEAGLEALRLAERVLSAMVSETVS
jgi:predicted dehydrogenase